MAGGMNIGIIEGTIRLRDDFTTGLGKISSGVQSIGSKVARGFGAANKATAALTGSFLAQAVSVTALAYGVKKLIELAAEQERVERLVTAGVKKSAASFGLSANAVKDYASELQKQTGIGDEVILKSAAVLLTFRRVQGDTFKETLKAAVDMSAVLGTDLQSQILQLGKALEDPARGLTMLARSGTTFTAEQTKMIKGLVEQNKLLEAQKLILAEVNAQYGGAAAAMRDTVSGALTALKSEWGDLLEVIGSQAGGGVLRIAIEAWIVWLRDFKEFLPQLPIAFFSMLEGMATELSNWIKSTASEMALWALKMAGALEGADFLPGVAKLREGFIALSMGISKGFAEVTDPIDEFAEGMGIKATEAMDAYMKGADDVVAQGGELDDTMDESAEAVKKMAEAMKEETDALTFGLAVAQMYGTNQEVVNAAMAAFTTVVKAGIDPLSELGREQIRLMTAAAGTNDELKRQTIALLENKEAIEADAAAFVKLEIEASDVEDALKGVVGQLSAMDKVDPKKIALASALNFSQAQDEMAAKLNALEPLAQMISGHFQDYKDALRAAADQLGLQLETIKKVKGIDLRTDAEKTGDAFRNWQSILGTVATALEGIDSNTANMIRSVIALAAAWEQVNAAIESGSKLQAAAAGAGMGSAIYGIGQGLGLWDPGGGQSKFGGQMSGNYGDLGATIGGAIGAMTGPYAAILGPVLSIVGGLIGSAIKKGADEGIVHIEEAGNAVVTRLIANEGGLGKYATGAAKALLAGLDQALAIIGGTLSQLPDIGIKIRDNIVSVTVGIVNAKFEELDEAISWALSQVLAQGGVTGIADELQAVLKNFKGSSVEDLAGALDLVQGLLDTAAGFTEMESALRALPNQIEALRMQLEQLGLTADQAERLAGAALIDQLKNMRDAITGRQKTAAEERAERERQAAMFNAQLALMRAEHEARKIELQQRAQSIATTLNLMRIEGNSKLAFLNAQGEIINAEADLMSKELGLKSQYVRVSAELLAAQQQILEQQVVAIDQILANLPKEIAPGEIRIGGGGGRGIDGGVGKVRTGPSKREQIDALLAELEQVRASLMSGFAQTVQKLSEWFATMTEQAEKLGIPLDEINELYAAQREELIAQAEAILGIPGADIVKHYEEMADALEFLKSAMEAGEMSAEDYAAAIEAAGQAAYVSIVDSLLQFVDDEETRMALEQIRYDMEIANILLQFELLKALELLTEGQIDLIQGLINNLPDAPPIDAGGGGAADSGPLMPGGGRGFDPWEKMKQAAEALHDAALALLDYYKSLIQDTSVSPLSLADRFAAAQADYAQLQQRIAEAQAEGDDELLAQLLGEIPDVAQQYLELAAQMFGTSTAGYMEIFDAVTGYIESLLGQYLEPGEWDWMRDRMDTLNSYQKTARDMLVAIADVLGAELPPHGFAPPGPGGDMALMPLGDVAYVPGSAMMERQTVEAVRAGANMTVAALGDVEAATRAGFREVTKAIRESGKQSADVRRAAAGRRIA